MKQLLILTFSLGLIFSCASTDSKDENSDNGMLKQGLDAAKSEAGQKALQSAKEKASDPALQEKVKETLKKKQQ